MDKRRSNEPILVGLNVRIAEAELAFLDEFLRTPKGMGMTKSAAARYLLVKALREELEGAHAVGKQRA